MQSFSREIKQIAVVKDSLYALSTSGELFSLSNNGTEWIQITGLPDIKLK